MAFKEIFTNQPRSKPRFDKLDYNPDRLRYIIIAIREGLTEGKKRKVIADELGMSYNSLTHYIITYGIKKKEKISENI